MAKRKKDKGRNDDPQNIAWKHKYQGELRSSRRVNSSYSTWVST
jgi:hypothetical protein